MSTVIAPLFSTFGVHWTTMHHPRTLVISVVLVLSGFTAPAQVADAGPDQWICGDSTDLQAAPLLPLDTGFWFVSQGNATFADASDPATTITDLALGENVFQWVLINSFGATSDLVSIWTYDPLAPVADAGPDQTVFMPPNYTALSANPYQAPCTCSWTVVSGTAQMQYPTSPTTTIHSYTPGTTVLQWTCDNGACGITTDEVVVEWALGTGQEERPVPTDRNLFHDPRHDMLVLMGAQAFGSVDILNSSGLLVHRMVSSPGSCSWSTADLPGGLYIARLIHGDEVGTLCFVVSH